MNKNKNYLGDLIPFKKDYLGNLDSTYVPQYAIGAATSPQTANQIAEATSRLNAGIFGVDISMVQPEIMEQIPKEHFKEIDRLMKLTGAKASLHGPIVDLAGFTQQGWNEEARKDSERQVKFFVERAHDLDEDGNTPINFHINTMMPGEQWRKISKDEYEKLGYEEKKPEYINEIRPGEYAIKESEGIVNRETGQLNIIRREPKNYPEGLEIWTPEKRLESMNQTAWNEEKLKIFEYQRQKAQIEDRFLRLLQETRPYEEAYKKGILKKDEITQLEELEKEKNRLESHINELNKHIHSNLNEAFNQLKYVPKEKENEAKRIIQEIDNDPYLVKVREYRKKVEQGESLSEQQFNDYQRALMESSRNIQLRLNNAPTPEMWAPANKIAKEKTVETIANVAFDSYNKYKDHAPIIVLENYQPMLTLGKSEDIAKTVEETRNKFAHKLIKEKNVSEDDAKNIAKKLIGVTWDVGHINFLRKHGYSEEDILEETKKIAPYVKQIHITDNFGFNDAHLPPGMGNAPIKEQLKILEKAGFKFEKGNVIVEAGAYVGQFKENPHLYALEYFESPLYTYKTIPYWKDIWETEGRYGLGYGPTLPEQHFAMYGTGFSSLPIELGGQIQSDRSRFAGTPNQ